MISSRTLKNFVKLHQHKLDAKIHQAEEIAADHNTDLESAHWGSDCIDDHHKQASGHWQVYKSASESARRPMLTKSSYFSFILTPTHQ